MAAKASPPLRSQVQLVRCGDDIYANLKRKLVICKRAARQKTEAAASRRIPCEFALTDVRDYGSIE
jgi:hypothetical protein